MSVEVQSFTNLYGCRIGNETRIGPFVEIQRDVSIGARCKIQSHSFLCSGVTIEDDVFVGHGAVFVNDKRPRATGDGGRLLKVGEWTLLPTLVGRGASIGSGGRDPLWNPHRSRCSDRGRSGRHARRGRR